MGTERKVCLQSIVNTLIVDETGAVPLSKGSAQGVIATVVVVVDAMADWADMGRVVDNVVVATMTWQWRR